MNIKTIALFFICLALLLIPQSLSTQQDYQTGFPHSSQAQGARMWGELPFYFIQNQGQLTDDIAFHIKLQHGNVFFEPQAITYQLVSENIGENLRLEFLGTNQNVQLQGIGPKSTKMNFFLSQNPDKWTEQASTFEKLLYRNIYPQIDLVVYEKDGLIKHEYIVKKGGDVSDILLRYSDVENLQVNDRGQLEIKTSLRILKEDTPFTYQIINGKRITIPSSYIVQDEQESRPVQSLQSEQIDQTERDHQNASSNQSGHTTQHEHNVLPEHIGEPGHTVKYSVGSYDSNHDLIIDPSLLYSTYLGGSGYDRCTSIAIDLDLNAYVVGHTDSNDFPTTPGVFDASGDDQNVLLTCFNPTGTELVYATFFGGSNNDHGLDIAFSWGDKTAVIVGKTESNNMPTTQNAYDRAIGGDSDAYIAKFRSNGRLSFATYFGGSDDEESPHVAIDGQGKIYLAGRTASNDLPISLLAYDDTFEDTGELNYTPYNIFVAAFNPNGSSLVYSTFYGGISARLGDIAVDFDGHAYITGAASRGAIPTTPGVYDEVFTDENGNGFFARLNTSGSALDFSSWLGDVPALGEYVYPGCSDIDIDGQGNIYITGEYTYEDFHIASLSHSIHYTVFVKKFNAAATQKLWDKQISGSGFELSEGLVVDGKGGLYIVGLTFWNVFDITDDAFQPTSGGLSDLFIQKLKTSNGKTLYSTYLGGNGWDYPSGIVTDSFGSVYVTGTTDSFDFPTTPGAFQTDYIAGYDGFVARIRDGAPQGELHALPRVITAKIPKGSTTTKKKNLKVSNKGSGVVNYQVSADQDWLTVSPASGSVRNEVDQVTVTISPKNIKKTGTHKGVVRIYSQDAFNSPQQVPVHMKIAGPKIKVAKKNYTITATAGGENPSPLSNKIKNSGKGKLRYRITPQIPWLSVTRKRGTSKGEWDAFEIKTDISELAVGVHSGTIDVTSKDTVDSVKITVTLSIKAPN